MHPMLCCVAKQERCRAFLFPGMRKIEDCLPEIREIWPRMMLEACWIVFAWGPINFKEPLHIGKKGALSSMLWFCNFGAPNVFITVLAADLLRPELHRHTVCLHRMIHMFLQVLVRDTTAKVPTTILRSLHGTFRNGSSYSLTMFETSVQSKGMVVPL